MPQAKQDLARMVAYKSVYDPRAPPPEDCDKMVDLAVDLFAGVGLQEVRAYETSDGSKAVCGHAAGPPGAPTVLLYFHHDVQPALGEDEVDDPGVAADRTRRPLVRPRRRRLQRQHRHPPDRPPRPRRSSCP